MAAARPLAERIQDRIDVRPNGCWLWQGASVRGGYGQMWVGSKTDGTMRRMLAHVVSYTLANGPVPKGLELDHLCHRPACVNPQHLEAVTRLVNMQRAHEHQRRVRIGRATSRRGPRASDVTA